MELEVIGNSNLCCASGSEKWTYITNITNGSIGPLEDSANNNDFSSSGDPSSRTGSQTKFGEGFNFDGDDDILRILSDSNLPSDGDLSLTAVFEFDTYTDGATLVSAEDSSNNKGYTIFYNLNNDRLVYRHTSGGSSYNIFIQNGNFANKYPTGEIHNLTLRRDDTNENIVIKIDGNTEVSQSYSSIDSLEAIDFAIGGDPDLGGFMDGGVYEFRVWNNLVDQSVLDDIVDPNDETYNRTAEGNEEALWFLETMSDDTESNIIKINNSLAAYENRFVGDPRIFFSTDGSTADNSINPNASIYNRGETSGFNFHLINSRNEEITGTDADVLIMNDNNETEETINSLTPSTGTYSSSYQIAASDKASLDTVGSPKHFQATAARSGTNNPTTNSSDIFNVSRLYQLSSDSLFFNTVMRGDTQRSTPTITNARGDSVIDNTNVTLRWYDSDDTAGNPTYENYGLTSSGNLDDDQSMSNSDTLGIWQMKYLVDEDSSGNFNNTMSETDGSTFNLDNSITVSSSEVNLNEETGTPLKLFNRGESIDISGTLLHADGNSYRVKTPSSNASRTIRIQTFLDSYGTQSSENTSVSVNENDGTFSAKIDLGTALSDTYSSSATNQSEALNYDIRFYDGTTDQSSNSQGNDANVTNKFDVDANYYFDDYDITYSLLNRGDTNRFNSSFVGVRNTSVPDGTDINVTWRNPSSVEEESSIQNTVSGITSNYDKTFSLSDELGNWDIGYEIDGSRVDNNGNSLSKNFIDNPFELSNDIQINNLDIDVSGESTTKYFNRGEIVNVSGNLDNARGDTFATYGADGSISSARNLDVELFYNTYGNSNNVTLSTVSVDTSTGYFSATVKIPEDATDTYSSSSAGQAESTEFDIHVFDMTSSETDTDGNHGNQTDFFDVDSEYYITDTNIPDTEFNRGDDDLFVNYRLTGVRENPLNEGGGRVILNDPLSNVQYNESVSFSSGWLNISDYTFGSSNVTGLWNSKTVSGSSSSGNTWDQTTSNAFRLTELLNLSSVTISTEYLNRGESTTIGGRFLNPYDGEVYSSRSGTLRFEVSGTSEEFTNSANTDSNGDFSETVSIPTDSQDTYDSSSPSVSETKDYFMNFTSDGNSLNSTQEHSNLFEVDSEYYVQSTNIPDTEFNRGDSDLNVNYYMVGVRSNAITSPESGRVALVDPNSNTNYNKSITFSSGWLNISDYAFGTSNKTGLWTSRTESFAGSNGNTWGHDTSNAFRLTEFLNMSGESIDIEYLNRGESATVSGNLFNPYDGEKYQRSLTLRLESHATTEEFTQSSSSDSNGDFSQSITIPTTASDTYDSTSPSQSETLDYALNLTSDGNTLNSTQEGQNLFDVDSEYYKQDYIVPDTEFNRGDDDLNISYRFVGVRSQDITTNSGRILLKDSSSVTNYDKTISFQSGWLNSTDYTFGTSNRTGLWNIESQNGSSSDGNTWHEINSNAIRLTNLLNMTGVTTSLEYVNRGGSSTFGGSLENPHDGEAYERPSGVTLRFEANGNTESFTDSTSTDSSGTFSKSTTIPTDAVDTYDSTEPGISETKDYSLNLTTDGNTLDDVQEEDNLFDVDGNYYLMEYDLFDTTLNRGDTQRLNTTFHDVRNTTVRDSTDVKIYWINPSGTDVYEGFNDTVSGVTDNYDQLLSDTDETGDWEFGFEIDGNRADNDGNSYSRTNETGFELFKNITIRSIDINVAGEDTSTYFNRGETVRVTGVLGTGNNDNFYRVRSPSGDSNRTIKVELFHDSHGTSSISSRAVTVDRADGTFSADISIPDTMDDTYSSSSAGQTETNDFDVQVYDSDVTNTGTQGNRKDSLNLFDVDSEYYITDTNIPDTEFNRGDDDLNVSYRFVGVRDNPIDAGSGSIRFIDPNSDANYDNSISFSSDGWLNSTDYSFGTSNVTGIWNTRTLSSGGSSGNTWDQTTSNAFRLTDTLELVSVSTNTSYYNRDETLSVSGNIRNPNDQESYSSRSVTLRFETGSSGEFSSSVTTDGSGAFTKAVNIPTTASDTYTSTSPSQTESLGYDLNVTGEGNEGEDTGLFDIDSEYYPTISTEHDNYNRGEDLNFTYKMRGVRSNDISSISVSAEVKDSVGTSQQITSDATNGTGHASYTYSFSTSDATGLWDINTSGSTNGNTWDKTDANVVQLHDDLTLDITDNKGHYAISPSTPSTSDFDIQVKGVRGQKFSDRTVDNWWDANWQYRKSIAIDNTGNSNSLSNYPVKLEIDTASLITANKLQSNGGDLRFVGSDNLVELDYYNETKMNREDTVIWVEVPSIPASDATTIYMYYNYTAGTATSNSNGSSTFNYFNDFSSDPSITSTNTCATNGGTGFTWSSSDNRIDYVMGYATCQTEDNIAEISLPSTISDSVAVHYDFHQAGEGDGDTVSNADVDVAIGAEDTGGNSFGGLKEASTSGSSSVTITTSGEKGDGTTTTNSHDPGSTTFTATADIRLTSSSGIETELTNTDTGSTIGTLTGSGSPSMDGSGLNKIKFVAGDGNTLLALGSGSLTGWVDNIFLRKYSNSEPSFTVSGTENNRDQFKNLSADLSNPNDIIRDRHLDNETDSGGKYYHNDYTFESGEVEGVWNITGFAKIDGNGGTNTKEFALGAANLFAEDIVTLNSSLLTDTVFNTEELMRVRINVTDSDGRGTISSVKFNLTDSSGTKVVENADMTDIGNITNVDPGNTYEYNYTFPSDAADGTWNITIEASDGENSSIREKSIDVNGLFIEVKAVKTYESSSNENNTFNLGDVVTTKVNVSHVTSASNLENALINITMGNGTPAVENGDMTNTKIYADAKIKEYEYNHTIGSNDDTSEWTIDIWANESAGNSDTNSTTITVQSQIEQTSIDVKSPTTYNIEYIADSDFERGDDVIIRTNVSHGDGKDSIDTVLLNLTAGNGTVVVDSTSIKNNVANSGTNWELYEYNYTLGDEAAEGTWTIKVEGTDTNSNVDSETNTFEVVILKEIKITINPTSPYTLRINGTEEERKGDLEVGGG